MDRNKIMKHSKKLFFIIMISVVVCCLAGCGSRRLSNEPTAYYVIYSGIAKKNCRIEGIDINGDPTVIHNIDAVNIGKSEVVGDEFIAGGHRANNHLIMYRDGSFDEFYLLDDPHYSGVWYITLDGSNIVSVMNGNVDFEENAYLNLIVIQDREHNIKLKKVIDVTPHSSLIDGDYLYMSGDFTRYEPEPAYYGASVARYNMITDEFEERHFSYDTDELVAASYWQMAKHGDRLYCVLLESLEDRDIGARRNKIDVIDCETLEIIDTLSLDGEIDGLCFVDEDLYIVVDNTLCKCDVKTQTIEELYAFPENTGVESLHTINGHIYFSARYYPAKKEGTMKNAGYIIDFDASDKSITETPLITDARYPESIVFFPLN